MLFQAKTLYGALIPEDEKQNIKIMIQRNLYTCIGILLEARQHFKEHYITEVKGESTEIASPGMHIVESSVSNS